jgi:RsiW-degrading membrane proteinase PrsW (M82 family)
MQNLFEVLLSLVMGVVPMFIFAYMVYWTDRYEKEPLRILLGAFLWGAIIAAGTAYLLNTLLGLGIYLFTNSDAATQLTTGTLIAPLVEESLKGLAVLIIFLAFRNEFDSHLDGIVYAAIVALGFAAAENAYYIYSYGFQENGIEGAIILFFVRVLLVGWQHPFYTAFIGIGLAVARLSKRNEVKIIAPLVGFGFAVFTHSIHNTFASLMPQAVSLTLGTVLDWSGWFIMVLFVLWAIYRENQWIVEQLREEVSLEIISPAQYTTACSAWSQTLARINAMTSGKYKHTNRFYQVCAELAFKKQQLSNLGEEGGNSGIILKLRSDLAQLAPYVAG